MLVVNEQTKYLCVLVHSLSFHSLHSVSMKLLYEVKCMQYFNTPETEFGRSDSLTDDLSQYRQVSNRIGSLMGIL